jgi:3-oxoacyl-[acyl-carrier protein] reductase
VRFAGKKVLVTGSAGAIGGAISKAFAAEGASLGLVDIKCSTVTASFLPETQFFEVLADVADCASLQAAINRIVADMGGADVLVNAAGVTSFGAATALSELEWDRVVSTNLKGVFFACQAVIQPMRARGRGGRIVNIGSLLAKNGGNARPWLDATEQNGSGNVAYGVSKAGVHALTMYLAKELAAAGITVNAVAPGPIASAMTTKFPERLRAGIPVGRMGEPSEVASAVLFLASEAASFITGEILDVNGGAWCD